MELLTISDIAKRLGLPESTVRYYRDRFPEYVPSVGDGRRRRYRPEAVDVLRFIADGLRNDRTATDIAEALSRMFPKTVDVNEEPQQSTAAAQQQPTAMTYEPQQDRNQTAAVMFAIMAQQAQAIQQIAASLDKLAAQAEAADALRKEVERLRNELAETAMARRKAEEKAPAQAALENAVMAKQIAAQTRDEARKHEEERRKREEERDRQVVQTIRQLQEAQRSRRPWWRRVFGR
jgi:DNA-binding transcriptional MerR regulator